MGIIHYECHNCTINDTYMHAFNLWHTHDVLMHTHITHTHTHTHAHTHTPLAAPNPCAIDNGNCSHMCLLSAIAPSGFSCVCPNDYILTENRTHCMRKMTLSCCILFQVAMCNLLCPLFDVAPPRLLFTVYSTLVRRVNTDGQNLVTIYTATYPRALDFDYQ